VAEKALDVIALGGVETGTYARRQRLCDVVEDATFLVLS